MQRFVTHMALGPSEWTTGIARCCAAWKGALHLLRVTAVFIPRAGRGEQYECILGVS